MRAAAVLLLILALPGCASIAPPPGPTADLRGTTIAVESVDGPPSPVVHKFITALNEEAAARQIAIVPRGAQALYRVRGYLAPQAGGTSIAWAWDIYDAAENRAFRLRGDERSAAGGRSGASRAWSDEQALRRIAHASIEQLMAFLSDSRGQPPAAPPPVRGGSQIVATRDDFGPEAAGIFRVPGNDPPPMVLGGVAAPGVPLPPHRPAPAAATLAFNGGER